MSNHEPVLSMNVDGVLYPVAMTKDQLTMFKIFVATISKEQPLNVLKKVPIVHAYEIAKKVNELYPVEVVR